MHVYNQHLSVLNFTCKTVYLLTRSLSQFFHMLEEVREPAPNETDGHPIGMPIMKKETPRAAMFWEKVHWSFLVRLALK